MMDYQNISRKDNQALGAMWLVLSGLLAGSVVGGEPPTSLPPTVGNPSVLQLKAFEAEYQAKTRNIVASEGKTLYGKKNAALRSMVGEEVYENGRRRVISELFPNRKRQSTSDSFAEAVSTALVRHLIYSGDRKGVVEVLAIDCPKLLEIQTTIEFELAVNGDHLHRSVAVLCDAFDLCTDDSNRAMIIAALRRGFEPMGIVQMDDKDFVRECRQWLSALDSTWEVSPIYGAPKTPLFIKRQTADK